MKYPALARAGLVFGVLLAGLGFAASCTVDDDFSFTLTGSGGSGGSGGTSDSVGGSGGSNMGDGGDASSEGCEAETKRCSDQQVEICAGSEWYPLGAPCEFACVAGICVGSCAPGSTQCLSGTVQQTCSNVGMWGPDEECPFACVGDSCGGECMPGAFGCSDDGIPQRCDDAGEWQNQQADPCVGECIDGLCDGPCDTGDQRCVSSTHYELCEDENWSGTTSPCSNQACVGTECQGVCFPGTTRCNPAAPTTQVQTCNTIGEWGAAAGCGDRACVDGKCVGECQPGMSRCNTKTPGVLEECNDEGTWETTTCPVRAPVCALIGTKSFCAECQPRTLGCEYQTPKQCNDDGKWVPERDPCKGEFLCHQGECSLPSEVCAKGSTASGCLDEKTAWSCFRNNFETTTCTNKQHCVDGACQLLL